jgi:aminoglycoside phosphotransferase (APT) family kinase protein
MKEPTTETHPLDEDRDPANAAAVRGFAAEVAAQYGGDLTRMRRALGYSNATWVGDGIAVRITHTPVDMAAEVALVRALPQEVGHPRILGVGTIEGHDWIVSEEVRGQNLHEAWPTLTPAERRRAIRQLWERVQIVHDATPSLRPLVGSHAGFIPATSDEATAAAARAGAAVGLSDVQRSRFHEIVEGYYRAAPFVEQVVTHGDLALVNALWDDGDVVALLDFEFAMLGPAEIDLCRLVWDGLVSEDGTSIDPDAGAAAFDIAARNLDPVHGRALLHGAAVLDQLRDLDIWLARGRTEERFEDWRPYRLLTGLLDPEGGYLAPLLR